MINAFLGFDLFPFDGNRGGVECFEKRLALLIRRIDAVDAASKGNRQLRRSLESNRQSLSNVRVGELINRLEGFGNGLIGQTGDLGDVRFGCGRLSEQMVCFFVDSSKLVRDDHPETFPGCELISDLADFSASKLQR